MKMKTIGRDTECDIVLDHVSVSRRHASIHVTEEGFLSVQDNNSSNGTFLHRNGRWIRIRKVGLGTQDRIRFGEKEVALDRLIEAFGNQVRVRLREGWSVRGKPLVFDQTFTGLPRQKTVLAHPRRNPITGKIEEGRQPPSAD
jgi:pSer/pThr/pTyr-binding forkhead associated (FHA) protein